MAAKQWVGAAPANPKDKVTVGYIQSQIAALNLPQATVDALIAQGFSTYTDLSYANTQAALNANKAYVDAGDATRLKLAQLNQPNGVAGLGTASAKVSRSMLGLGSTQRWPTPYSSPGAYNASPVTTGLTEETVYSWTVANPGYAPYKLLVDGILDGSTSRDGYYPVVVVRAGAVDGPAIAVGYGLTENYSGAVVSQFNISVDTANRVIYNFTYTIPVWAATIDILLLGGGGGGAGGMGNPLIWGDTGAPGAWSVVSLTVGSGPLPTGVTQITGTIGAGGVGGPGAVFSNPGAPGGTTVATYYQTTMSAAGGAGGNGVEGNQGPVGAGAVTVGGHVYQSGGFGQGGMGGPGGFFVSNPGQKGGDGMALIVAHPLGGDFNTAPINVIPLPLAGQPALTGDTLLYVNLLRSIGDNTNNGTVTASTFEPSMYATVIPA